MDNGLKVRPLDGGAARPVGPPAEAFAVRGRQVLVMTGGRDHFSLLDFVTGSHLLSFSLPIGLRVLGFSAAGEVLAGACPYRADDAGLERGLLRLSADGGSFEPYGKVSCPVGLSYDDSTTYVFDYTPPERELPGSDVLRRVEPDGTTVRLPVVAALFVRANVAFRFSQREPQADGGPPVEIEAVSLVDGGVHRVVTLHGRLWGFAIDRQSMYVLYEHDTELYVAPLPEVLRGP